MNVSCPGSSEGWHCVKIAVVSYTGSLLPLVDDLHVGNWGTTQKQRWMDDTQDIKSWKEAADAKKAVKGARVNFIGYQRLASTQIWLSSFIISSAADDDTCRFATIRNKNRLSCGHDSGRVSSLIFARSTHLPLIFTFATV